MMEKNNKEKYLKLEPPKNYYFISEDGDMWSEEDLDGTLELKRKMIGNYFESEEEVRKAYKKLLAWKRLKDKGFKIKGWKFTPDMKHIQGNYVKIEAEIPQILVNEKDIDLLFGGEE